MKILTPTTITDAMLVSCTVAENDHTAWSAATAYNEGDKVIRTQTHRIYERKVAGTTATAPESDPDNWLDLGATNRWRMFDDKVGTVTSATGGFTVKLTPGIATSIALVGVSAATVQIKVTDATDGVVFDKTFGLYDASNVTDYWNWFFEDVRRRDTLVVDGLPSYRNATLEVILADGVAETVRLGALVVGRIDAFAPSVLYGASVGIQDYSRKERDDWGNAYVSERGYSRRARWSFVFQNRDLDALQRKLAALRARPAVYVGSDRFDATAIYGFFRDFDVVISYPYHSECLIEIEGLT